MICGDTPIYGWMYGWMGRSIVGVMPITKNWINLDLIEIFQFCLKIYDLWRHLHLWMGVWVVGWVDGWVNWWIDGWGYIKSVKLNKLWPNRNNQFNSEYLWFVETPSPMGGYMGVLMDGSFFWHLTSYLNHLSPLQGYFFSIVSTRECGAGGGLRLNYS